MRNAAVDKEWEKLEKLLAWQNDHGEEQKGGGHPGSTKREKESPFCFADGHLSSKNTELEPKYPTYEGWGCAPR